MTDKIKNIAVICVMTLLVFGIALLLWTGSTDDYSLSERRPLSTFPELTTESVFSGDFMQDFESYTLDQFPFRDDFRTLKAMTVYYGLNMKDNNGIFVEDGHISKIEYPINYAMLDYSSELFKKVHDKYLAESSNNIYFSIIPDKSYYLAKPNGYLSLDYDELISYMRENTKYMQYIDVTELLSPDDYYRTDSHWRQKKIFDVAQKLASGMGGTLSAQYSENVLDNPFYGVYYGQSALRFDADGIIYLTNDTLENCTVKSFDGIKYAEMDMYDMDKAYGKDPYEMFLSGTQPLVTIENPNAATDKELIIFRDSFASSLAPLLTEQYAKITLIDLRYVQSDVVGNFVEFGGQDVLFIYSTTLLNNSLAMK